MQGNYPELLAYVRNLSPDERAPEGMLDKVTEYSSSYRPKVMKRISEAIGFDLARVRTATGAVKALNQVEFRKHAMAERDARWIFGLIAAALILIGWFWQSIQLSFINRKNRLIR